MIDFSTPDVVLQVLSLALPVGVLLTLLSLLSRRKSRVPPAPLTVFNGGGSGPAAPKEKMMAPLDGTLPDARPDTLGDTLGLLHNRLKAAERGRDKSALAPLYLEIARAYRDAGRESDFLTALRSAAGLGAQHGPKAAHASARLELAEAAFDSGDLTSACEHWQLAKNALLEDAQREAHARVEKRMRDHGCPTDWVLTDF